ncbi:hypothetical protein DB30_01301 [Enhygromyxa salina]|uniref:eCIS core domain-containing protein n=1 Tax=Enhygromyxa salina TaxID=215803 RepID=A0A0C1Z485_9BACT|nr:hypothetical protein DB30_01301 [Enhygromyxa salina]
MGHPVAPDLDARIQAERQLSGRPIAPEWRSSMERRLGQPLAEVRVRQGSEAENLTRALDTSAFTVGRDVFLGARRSDLGRFENAKVFQHELAHVAQNRRGGDLDVIRRAPDAGASADARPANPYAGYTFGVLYFRLENMEPINRNYDGLAEALIERIGDKYTATEEATRLYLLLLEDGRNQLAAKALPKLDRKLMAEAAGWAAPHTFGGFDRSLRLSKADKLLAAARTKARQRSEKNDEIIFRSLELVLRMMTWALVGAQIRQDRKPSTTLFYQDTGEIFSIIREIYGLYPSLTEEALLAGDPDAASDHTYAGNRLYVHLDEFLKTTPMFQEIDREFGEFSVMADRRPIMRISTVMMRKRDKRGPGGRKDYTVEGTNGVDERANAITIEQAERDEADFPETPASLMQEVHAQGRFIRRIYNIPEIREAFANRIPDLDSKTDRVVIWGVLYERFERFAPGHGLELLFREMEDYLGAFTQHIMFSIRDAGTPYSRSTMPKDIAGRFRQDCGVYALTIAEEMHQVSRANTKLDLQFELYFFPGHVALVIRQRDGDHFFVVNNDQIHGPLPGTKPPRNADMDKDTNNSFYESLAQSYGKTMGFGNMVSPAAGTNLGSTKDSPTQFQDRSWSRYRAISAGWGISPAPYRNDFGDLPMSEQEMKAYEQYTNGLEEYDKRSKNLVAQLQAWHAKLLMFEDSAKRKEFLRGVVLNHLYSKIGDETLRTIEIFGRFGFGAVSDGYVVVDSPRVRDMIDIDLRYIFTSPGNGVPAVVRYGRLVNTMLLNNVVTFTSGVPAIDITAPDAFVPDNLSRPATVATSQPFVKAFADLMNSGLASSITVHPGKLDGNNMF